MTHNDERKSCQRRMRNWTCSTTIHPKQVVNITIKDLTTERKHNVQLLNLWSLLVQTFFASNWIKEEPMYDEYNKINNNAKFNTEAIEHSESWDFKLKIEGLKTYAIGLGLVMGRRKLNKHKKWKPPTIDDCKGRISSDRFINFWK